MAEHHEHMAHYGHLIRLKKAALDALPLALRVRCPALGR